MEINDRAVKAIFKEHCWRHGKTTKPSNNPAGRDANSLGVEKRAEIEEVKFNKDHPIDDDPFDIGE